MLSHEDNERITRVGKGTPAGELFRRYWQPALLSEEIPENDCPPVRVRLLGEDLIAFRDSTGKVGLVDAYCPHRHAPLFFGRNEDCGIRCLYHGWKFDTDGNCVDLPSEPAGTAMKARIKLKSYPVYEKAGIVFAYLGAPEKKPPVPDYEWMRIPSTHFFVSKTFEDCNYLQGLEGGLDTVHASFLHQLDIHSKTAPRMVDTSPKLEIERTPYGYYYVSTRNVGPDRRYVRLYHYIMPNQQFRAHTKDFDGSMNKVPKLDGHFWVPCDDYSTNVYNMMCSYDMSWPLDPDYIEEWEYFSGRSKKQLIPGSYKLKSNRENDYFIDRHEQRTKTFSGIHGINTQDYAMQENMGSPIVDRTQEHLGTSDLAIVSMRRLMLEAIRDVEEGKDPRGLDPESCRNVRPYDDYIVGDKHWRDAFGKEIYAKW
ncbi:MAG: hypothetical protein RLZ98_1504 [Pseudomonadota bacterium]|jgi:phenylpropionate dioxygenase-like ring-hydroxylating dioxygenase large terminal subunit